MEETTSGETFESMTNPISITEKLNMLPSTAQSRGLPAMAPVYRIPKDRKPFTYKSFYPYPKEKKPKQSFPLNIAKPTPIDPNIRLTETQISIIENPIIKSSVRPNDDDDLELKKLKTSITIEENKEEIKEPEPLDCVTFVYDTWPEPKGYCPATEEFL